MKTRADDAPLGKGWDDSVLVWNATVARIPPPAVRPDSVDDATRDVGDWRVTDGRSMPYRELAASAKTTATSPSDFPERRWARGVS